MSFRVSKDKKYPGYYIVNGGKVAGKYLKQIQVYGEESANEISANRNRLLTKKSVSMRIAKSGIKKRRK